MENEQNKTLESIGFLYLTTLLDDMWRGFKKFFWLLFVLAGACAAVFYVNARKSYTPSYTAYASFVIEAQTPYGYSQSYSNKTAAEQMSNTFPYILTSGALQEVIMEDLGIDYMPASISAEATAGTALFTLNVTSSDPEMAYNVLQSVIENYPKVAEYIIGTTKLTKMDESGIPTEPSNPPNYMGRARSGAMAGTILFILFLLFYAMGRRTVRREEDLKNRFSIPMLGSIPFVKGKKRGKSSSSHILLTDKGASAQLGEPIRTIRMRVLKEASERDIHCLMVTSAVAGEGKSTTAVNLALSMAKKGVKVILVDGDLRHPSVAPILGIESEYGIADILRGDVKTTEVLKAAGEDGLLVIPGTKPVKNPTELISSENMQRLIYQLKKAADYVIIDTPPCTVMSDASVFARMTQGIVMVVRQDFARLEKVVSGFEILVETGTPLIGYILDGTAVGITGYGHGYGYGYGKYGYGKYGYGKYGYGKYGYGKYGYGYGADQEKREKKQESEKKDTKSGHTDRADKKKEET